MKRGQEEMKVSQEEMKEDMKRGQEEMKEDMKKSQRSQEEMRRAQEEMKASHEEVKVSQEEMKEDNKASQEKLLQEMKTAMEENNAKLETKLNEFEQVVEEEINLVKDNVKAVKEEMNKKIEDLETKFAQLSTMGVIKTEGTVTTPSKVKFEAVVRNWREEDKATSLIAALRGEALEVLRTITETIPNYATLTSALERRCGYAHLQHVYQAQLRSRRQRFEETLQQYEADISRMVNLTYPTAPAEVVEQLSVSSFIEGLRDPEIGQLVRLARHKTISEALAQALQVKTYQYQDRERKMQSSSKNLVDSMKDVLEKFTDGQNSKDSTTNKTSFIRRRIFGFGTDGSSPIRRIMVPACHTIVKPNIVAYCRIQNTDEDYQLETANGEVIPLKGIHLAEIRLGNSTFRQKVFVADITDDVLLGLNVMAEQNFILDLPQRVLKTNNEEIILNFPKIRALPIRTVKASEDKRTKLLHHKGILTGRTLTVRKNNQMFVRIMNLKDYPQQISKGEPIAYRSAVHESTGKTPASVVFGAELRLPIDLISDRPKEEEGVDNYLSRLQDRLRLTHTEVRQNGEKVWLYNPKRTKGKSPKLQKSWEGPYTVVTRLNDVVYRIQKNPQAKMKVVHIDRLTPYQEPHPNEGVTWSGRSILGGGSVTEKPPTFAFSMF
ncbi:hypothetical protein NQ315_017589 [Exocentrus adspersus]|uniref:Integrase p58-like C-terminal domain-containing protein n=1 Tax=Exocentrus adspersus TaxID=1586481 RepID=A0AAV8VIP6_9CUCU|nr:hypothetical protein NQ315_017589 [Exocentrus adspersus]